ERPGRLPGDGHIRRIAAERLDVALDPAQRLDLVLQTVVAGNAERRFRAEPGMSQVAQNADPVIDRDDDNALPGHLRSVVDRLVAEAAPERAAVDPDHNRRLARARRRPDVERETVLAHLPRI